MLEMFLHDPGEGLLEAEIVTWQVRVGDEIAVNDIVLEIETAKSLVELPSPYAGVVAELCVEEGAVVPVGTLLMRVAEPGESVVSPAGAAPAAPQGVTPQTPVSPQTPTVQQVRDAVAPEPTVGTPAAAQPEQGASSGAMLVGYGARTSSSGPAAAKGPRGCRSWRRARPGAGVVRTSTSRWHAGWTRCIRCTTWTPCPPGSAAALGVSIPGRERLWGAARSRETVGAPHGARAEVDLADVEASGPDGTITERTSPAPPPAGVRTPRGRCRGSAAGRPAADGEVDDVVAGGAAGDGLDRGRHHRHQRASGEPQGPPRVRGAARLAAAGARQGGVPGDRPARDQLKLDLAADELVVFDDVNLGIAAATPRGLVVPNVKAANEMNLVQLAEALNQLVVTARRDASPGRL